MDLVHVEKSVKKFEGEPLNNPAYNMLMKSKPPPLSYEHYSAGLLAAPPVETISKERVNGFLARQARF
jgi:hypothetical protein